MFLACLVLWYCFLVFFGIGFIVFLVFLYWFFVLLELVVAAAPVQSAPLRHRFESFIL